MGMYKKWNCCLCKELCEYFECFEKEPSLDKLEIIKNLTETINNIQKMEFSGAMRHYAEEKFGYDSDTGKFEKENEMGSEWDDYDLGMFGIYDSVYSARRNRDSRGRFTSNRRGGGNRSGRGGRGRSRNVYDAYDAYNIHYPPYYNMEDEEDNEEEMMMYSAYNGDGSRMPMQNAGGRSGSSSGGRNGSSGSRGGASRSNTSGGGGSSGNSGSTGGTYNYKEMPPYYEGGHENMMYRVRQENGRPIMERMYAHGDKEKKPKKLTNEQYDEWMKKLENDDGTMGPHFSKEEVKKMAEKLGIDFKDFTEKELEVATNIMYSDYCDSVGAYTKSPEAYVKLAVDFLDDEDAPMGPSEKLAAYYNNIVEG